VIGEVSNMVVGSVKSVLCDTGFPCNLTIPSIMRGQGFSIGVLRSSDRRLLTFNYREEYIHAELRMKH